MTKVDIVSGFLGAGKTTLIKKLLKDALHDTKVVLIENEFGEIGIDGGFLKEAGIQIREMNSGCICCSLVGDFGASLKEVMAQYAPERILIEPSGVGKLSDVSRAVKNAAEGTDMVFGSAVTVVDAARSRVDGVMGSVAEAAESLRDVTMELKRNPSLLIREREVAPLEETR